MTTFFDTDISPLALTLLGILFIFTLYILTVYTLRLRLPGKCRAKLDVQTDFITEPQQPVSVIVYARDNSARLEALLNDLLAQEYSAGYEIIVVNDSGGYECSDVVTRLAMNHPNLRMTFVPEKAHNLSRKKLAITLGLKAARNGFVLLLNAESRLRSTRWLTSMARDTEKITLGQAVITTDDGSQLPLMMRFDQAYTSVKWISAALKHHPYRGNGYNLAYPAELFFANDGFAGTLNLQAGDDDLFIKKISNGENTRIELSEASIVSIVTSRPRELFNYLKTSHTFTARRLPSQPTFTVALALLWLSIGLAIALSVIELSNIVVAAGTLVLLLTQWIVTSRTWHNAARAVGIDVSAWQALPALLWSPFYNIRYRLLARSNKSQHYTWQKQKKI